MQRRRGIARPPEPSDSGWFSGKALLPSRLVVTGASSSSASRLQLRPRLGVVHALAGVDHRTLGVDQELCGFLDMRGIGAIPRAQHRRVVQGLGDFLVPHVGRDLDDDRAAATVLQPGEGAAQDVADLIGNRDRLGRLGVRLHRLTRIEVRVDVGDPPRVALRQHQHRDGLAVGLRDAAHGVFRAGTVLHAEDADVLARGDAGDGVRHVHADALLAHDDGADVGVGGVLDQMIDRIAAEDLDPLALHDFRDCRAELHGRFSPQGSADCPTRPSSIASWNRRYRGR